MLYLQVINIVTITINCSFIIPRNKITIIEIGKSVDAHRTITEMLVLTDKDVKTTIINVLMNISMFETNKKIKYLSK